MLGQSITRNSLLLAAFAIAAALTLAGSYLGTKDRIAAEIRKAEEKAKKAEEKEAKAAEGGGAEAAPPAAAAASKPGGDESAKPPPIPEDADHYQVLGVETNATAAQIKKAWGVSLDWSGGRV